MIGELGAGGIDAAGLLAAFRKVDLLAMARDLSVAYEVDRRDRKAKIVADLAEVLAVEDVVGWAELAGFQISTRNL